MEIPFKILLWYNIYELCVAVRFTDCPGNKEAAADFGTNRKRIYWNGEVAVQDGWIDSSTHQSGSYFEFGSHSVRIVATDGERDVHCNFGVKITDEEIPNITYCPADVTISITQGEESRSRSSLSLPDSTAMDYIDDNPDKIVLYEADNFLAGVTRVTHIYTDFSCNRAICEFSVSLVTCPGTVYQGYCYFVECNVGNYDGYVSACISAGAQPISIHSLEEDNFVKGIAVNVPGDMVFIGLVGNANTWQRPTYDQVYWSDGTTVDYLDDANDLEVFFSQPCYIMYRHWNYAWEEVGCDKDICGYCKKIGGIDVGLAIANTCPNNIILQTESGTNGATATWTPPVVNIEGQDIPITSSHQPGDFFYLGQTTVEISTTYNGNTGYCMFTVFVEDWEDPVFVSSCVAESFNLPEGANTVTYPTHPVVTDNSGNFNLVCHTGWVFVCPGDDLAPGTYWCKHTLSDEGRCTGQPECNRRIDVYDVEDPVITCPSPIPDAVADPGQPHAAITLEVPTATDNVAVTALYCDQSGLRNMNIGTTTITCTAVDAAGNNDVCTYDITVEDTQAPEIVACPPTLVETVASQDSDGVVTWQIIPTFSDNSGDAPTVTSTHNNGDTFPIGDTIVTFTATDGAGLETECIFIVRLEDHTPPVFNNCPDDIVVSTSPGLPTGPASWEMVNATDNSLNVPFVDDSSFTGTDFPIGETYVQFNATDNSGNMEICGFTVVVMDDESPIFFNCPEDQLLPTDPLVPTTNVIWNDPTATDNSGISPDVTQTHYSNDVFSLGTDYVFYEAVDSSSNWAQCNFSVTIFDNEAPIFFNGSQNLIINTDPGLPTAPAWWSVTDIATDNSQEIPSINCTYEPGHVFRFGNHTVNCVATDSAENSKIHTFYIAIIDEEIPTFTTQPSDIVSETDWRKPHAFLNWALPTVFENSMEEVYINSTHQPNTTFPIGETIVTYWAYDIFYNVNQFSFNITVVDTEFPVFYNLTPNITIVTEESVNYTHVEWTVVDVRDNSGRPLNISSDFDPGDVFYVGYTFVTYTAIDESGNINWFTFSILVIDVESPVFVYCPPDIVMETWYRSPEVNVTWQLPNVTENVGVLLVVSNYNPGDVFYLGETTVVYNATDSALNFQDCQFLITVIDVEKPYFLNCTRDFEVINIPGTAYANVSWVETTGHDNSQIQPTVTSDAHPGDTFPLYETIVTYTAIDEAGNVETCQFTITVNDVDIPYFTNITEDIQVFIDSIYSNVTVDWDPPYPADNSGALPLLESTHNPGDIFPEGITMVTYTATDDTGNIQTQTFRIRIRVPFTDLKTMLYNGTDDIDILEISAIAVDRGKTRPLSNEEVDDLEFTLISMSETKELIGDREPATMTEEIINVTTTVVERKKNMAQQIDIVLASEIILTEIATKQTNTTVNRSSKTVASNIELVENRIWSFHFRPKEEKLYSTKDNAKKANSNDKGFMRVDPSSAKRIPESASIVVMYFDPEVFTESEGDEKSSVTFSEDVAEYIVPVPYELASGLITCTVSTNTSKYPVAIDFSMKINKGNTEDEVYYKEHAVCSFWDEESEEWGTSGCRRTDVIEVLSEVTCRCDHTTTFGIFVPAEKYSDFDYLLLAERMGIYLVCLLSIIAILYVMKIIHFIWGLFKGPVTMFIYSNLLIGSLLLTVTFVISSETMDFSMLCTIFGVLIHFFYMSLLMWLIIECIYYYMLKTKMRIEGSSISKKLGYFICGWGGAACVAALFFGIHYGYNDISGCWLRFETGSLVAFIFPSMTLIMLRVVLMVFVLMAKFKGKMRKEYIRAQIRRSIECSCFLILFLIFTWVFAIMVDDGYVFWLFFYILFSANGIFVALYCYCSYEMREVRRINRSMSSQTLTRASPDKLGLDYPIDLGLDDESCLEFSGEPTPIDFETVTNAESRMEGNDEVKTENNTETDESHSDTESEESSEESSESSDESSNDESSKHSEEENYETGGENEKKTGEEKKTDDEESDDYDSDDACFGK